MDYFSLTGNVGKNNLTHFTEKMNIVFACTNGRAYSGDLATKNNLILDAVRSRAGVMLLLVACLLLLPLFCGDYVLGPCFVMQYLVSFLVLAIIWLGRRARCIHWLFSWCLVAVSVQWVFLTVQWVGLQCVFVAFPDHTLLRLGLVLLIRIG